MQAPSRERTGAGAAAGRTLASEWPPHPGPCPGRGYQKAVWAERDLRLSRLHLDGIPDPGDVDAGPWQSAGRAGVARSISAETLLHLQK